MYEAGHFSYYSFLFTNHSYQLIDFVGFPFVSLLQVLVLFDNEHLLLHEDAHYFFTFFLEKFKTCFARSPPQSVQLQLMIFFHLIDFALQIFESLCLHLQLK